MTNIELRERRKALHLTQQQVADATGVSQQNYARWESGKVSITHLRAAWLERELSRLERAPA